MLVTVLSCKDKKAKMVPAFKALCNREDCMQKLCIYDDFIYIKYKYKLMWVGKHMELGDLRAGVGWKDTNIPSSTHLKLVEDSTFITQI